jgi:hypothetical protein
LHPNKKIPARDIITVNRETYFGVKKSYKQYNVPEPDTFTAMKASPVNAFSVSRKLHEMKKKLAKPRQYIRVRIYSS